MSIELRQAAEQVLEAFDTFGEDDYFASLFALTQKMNALRDTLSQQPVSEEHLFEFWWEAHMPNANKENAWSAFTAAIASNRVGIAAQQPAKGEPVAGEWFCGNCRVPVPSPASRPAPSVPDDVVRDAERWRTFLAARPSNTHEGIIAAIDAAMLAAKEAK